MDLQIIEETADILDQLGEIPISFEVRSLFRVDLEENGLGGIRLTEEPVDPPWLKDCDAEKEERPLTWRRWDLTNWGFISAMDDDLRAGCAVIATDTQDVNFLEDRKDLAALWDIRVRPDYRGKGVGRALMTTVEEWSRKRGCIQLKIETQNINVPACRFYAAMGAQLGMINRFAYQDYPDEIELIWYKDL